MWILYDLIFAVFALLWFPVYLFRRKFHRGFSMRLGALPHGLELNRPIWIHAVSVGEINAAGKLIVELRAAYPDKKFFITTVTPTGNRIAKGFAASADFVAYLPLDFSFITRGVVNRINPALFIIMETEIWPNLIRHLKQRNIPMVLANARISDRSFKGYRMIKFLLKPILGRISLFCAQTQADAQRLARLGAPEDKIKITGNMKFDIADYAGTKTNQEDLKLKLGLGVQDKLLVCGSTHPGEEEIILGAYAKLLGEFPSLRLLIAPRHPERAKEIEKLVLKNGFPSLSISNICLKPNTDNLRPVFILDTIGELISFYAIADVVFVGGSLIKKGGQNILEPAGIGKPVIFGPHMFNFRDIAGLFLENKAAVLARNQKELEASIRDLLHDPQRMAGLAQRARALIAQNQGATRRNLEIISKYLVKGG
ncbi:MAG: 3-deoxy-D-manno-octulosonic acid transferase [Candidatus Omnitrophota bacterium]